MRAARHSQSRAEQRVVMPEERRLEEAQHRSAHWKRWGPYLSERAWGTVQEDYSRYGTAWDHFPHDHARSKAYRWGEDGIGGFCDRHQYICFALALWNGRDPILKERLFGLTGNEGNHGEDVKEYYFYLDSTPTHSYMKFLYKYPQMAYPYAQLVAENRRRCRQALEYELLDTGAFEADRYFDVFVDYAKGTPEDILIRIKVVNRGPETAELNLLPTIWFRNTWAGGMTQGSQASRLESPYTTPRSLTSSITTTVNASSAVKARRSYSSPTMKRITGACTAPTTLLQMSKMASTTTSYMVGRRP